MRSLFPTLTILVLALIIVAEAVPSNLTALEPHKSHAKDYEAHTNQILKTATKRLAIVWNRRREIFLNNTKGRGYSVINQAPIKLELDNDYRHIVFELAANLSVIPVVELESTELRRQVQRLSKLQLYGLNDVDFEHAKDLLRRMNSLISIRLVCSVTHSECTKQVAMVPGIITHAIRTKRLEEIEYYWVAWRNALLERNLAKSSLINYVRLLRKAAAYNGHVTPSRTWYLYFDTENFQRELEDVVWELMPLYRELHAYLRHSIKRTYANREMKDDAAISAPVMEQIIHQAWYPQTTFILPYPKSPLPQVQPRLEQVLVSPPKVNRRAAEFFESLGLQKLPNLFYEKYARRISDDESGPDCKSEVIYFPPHVALRYCPKLDYKKLMQMHGHMAELHYDLYRKDLPIGLDDEPCPGFRNAIGEAAVLSSGTPRHLNRLHILFNKSLDDEQAINRQFRMAVHIVLAIPQFFINDKFLVDIMDGRIASNEYNCGYWRLQYKYAGVVPPTRRNEQYFDPDYKFYKGLNPEKSNTMKFISEILGHQFYRAFCLASEQYRPGDPEYPLHNCDFYNNTKAGDMIKKMMKLGATKHWRDVMEIATGERKLSARGVIEYFAPLFSWLMKYNKEQGIEVGWDADIRCGY